MESNLRLSTPEGAASMLLVYGRNLPGKFRGTVLVYHGLGASKEVQRKECQSLAKAGFLAVAVDAVGHGERRFPDFDARMSSASSHKFFLEMVYRSALEIPALVSGLEGLLGTRAGRFAITGISMGGYIAFAAAGREPRLAAIVPILGSPDWSVRAKGDEELLAHSPHLAPHAFPPRGLCAFNAGRDHNVPAAATRAFVEQLRPLYQNEPARLEYREYPDSDHFMQQDDWDDLWSRLVRFLERNLA